MITNQTILDLDITLKPPETKKNAEFSNRSWAGLFTKKERGPALFKAFSSAQGSRTSNKNALIINISHLTDITSNIIMQALAT